MKFLIAFLVVCNVFYGLDPIAFVTKIRGDVIAVRPDDKSRDLDVESPVFVKDLIQTASRAVVQLRFLDGSILNLHPSTSYSIDKYSYGKFLSKEESKSELIEGGFKLLTGKIKSDPSRYNIKTPKAVIGIRGTLLEAVLTPDQLSVACTKGQVEIKNDSGTIVIGEGMAQYAVVTSYSRRPRIFIAPPTSVVRPIVPPRVGR